MNLYRVRVSPTLSVMVGPCSPSSCLETLRAWGYVKEDPTYGPYTTVDVAIVPRKVERFSL